MKSVLFAPEQIVQDGPWKSGRGKHGMGWNSVWQLALRQLGAEPVEIQLVVIVAAAFLVLMILLGLRNAFHAAGPLQLPAVPDLPKRVYAAVAAVPASSPAQPFRARKPKMPASRKSAKRTINRQCAPRPKIRRAALAAPAENHASYSPLSPRRGGDLL